MASEAAEQAYDKLRNIVMLPKNKNSIDILKIWYTDEDAKILTAGPFRTVTLDRYTIEKYAKRAKLPEEKVRETFERLAHRGVLFWYYSRKDGKKNYYIPPLFPGLVEAFIINPNVSIDERRAFLKKFHSMEGEGFLMNFASDYSVFRIVPALKPEAEGRLIQVDEALEVDKSQVLTYQDVTKIIESTYDIAVMPCTCRMMSMMLKTSPECERSVEVCMVFGSAAKYFVEENFGRHITKEEALDILKQSEKEGLIHCTQNTKFKHGFICNCCTCCCGVISTAIKMNYPELFQKSDYVPIIDNESCKLCKKCVNLCPFHALFYKIGPKEDKSEDKIVVREQSCVGCGLCASNCPQEAINLKKIRDNVPADTFMDAIQQMMQDRKI